MSLKFPALRPFLSKLLYELLPAAAASAIGGLIFNHFANTPSASTAAATPSNIELVQMARDEHALFIDSLKKYVAAREQADAVAAQEMDKARASEQAALAALREARAAEARALATAHKVAQSPAKLPARSSPHGTDKGSSVEPQQVSQPTNTTAAAQPIPPVASSADHDNENIATATVHDVAKVIEQVPSWINSVAGWFSGSEPPRPPSQLAPRQFMNATM
jgi:hypothetical protein